MTWLAILVAFILIGDGDVGDVVNGDGDGLGDDHVDGYDVGVGDNAVADIGFIMATLAMIMVAVVICVVGRLKMMLMVLAAVVLMMLLIMMMVMMLALLVMMTTILVVMLVILAVIMLLTMMLAVMLMTFDADPRVRDTACNGVDTLGDYHADTADVHGGGGDLEYDGGHDKGSYRDVAGADDAGGLGHHRVVDHVVHSDVDDGVDGDVDNHVPDDGVGVWL